MTSLIGIEYVGLGSAIDAIGERMFPYEWQQGETGERWGKVVERIDIALKSGELVGGYSLLELSVWPMTPEMWTKSDIEWFRRQEFQPHGGPSFAALFIDQKSLRAFLWANWRPIRSSAPFVFQHNERRWRLFDAVVWAATGGAETTTSEIAEQNLDEKGARILFGRLDEVGMFRGPEVTGLSPLSQHRFPMHPAWERVHTGWLGMEGHKVSFYESPQGFIEADLTEYRRTSPSYLDIRIDRVGLMALFGESSGLAAEDMVSQPLSTSRQAGGTVEAGVEKALGPQSQIINDWFNAHGGVNDKALKAAKGTKPWEVLARTIARDSDREITEEHLRQWRRTMAGRGLLSNPA